MSAWWSSLTASAQGSGNVATPRLIVTRSGSSCSGRGVAMRSTSSRMLSAGENAVARAGPRVPAVGPVAVFDVPQRVQVRHDSRCQPSAALSLRGLLPQQLVEPPGGQEPGLHIVVRLLLELRYVQGPVEKEERRHPQDQEQGAEGPEDRHAGAKE